MAGTMQLLAVVCMLSHAVMGMDVLYEEMNQMFVNRTDDGCSDEIHLGIDFRFFGQVYDSLYVCSNGILSFNGSISTYTPTEFPVTSQPIVAPFFADVDFRQQGSVTYSEYTSGPLLDAISLQVNAGAGDEIPPFTAVWAFLATWYEVPAFPGDGEEVNTFQAVLVSDGTFSFVIFNYQGDIEWTYGSASDEIDAQVGFDAGNGHNFFAHQWSRTEEIANIAHHSNIDVPGRWLFRADLTTIEEIGRTVMYTRDEDEMEMHRNDDGCSDEITLSTNFNFFGEGHETLYVCTNGIISFGGPISTYTPTPFPVTDQPIVAPFFGDVDLREAGDVTFKEYTSGRLLNELTNHINDIFGEDVPNFQVSSAFMATWDNVTAFPGDLPVYNTFQAVLATDGSRSFVVFNYDKVQWTYGSASGGIDAQVGFDAGNNVNFYAHPWSRSENIKNVPFTSNVDVRGRFIFHVDEDSIQTHCELGYSGRECDRCSEGFIHNATSHCVYDHCTRHLCIHGAECVNEEMRYTCECTEEYYGEHCEHYNMCVESELICENGGECQPETGACMCAGNFGGETCDDCVPGWRGGSCGTRDFCYQHECMNEARCRNGDEEYTCECMEGYFGVYCESFDLCLANSVECMNDGMCMMDTGMCECGEHFAGERCEMCADAWTGPDCMMVNYCNMHHCQHDSVCINGEDDYTCECTPGYVGTFCETFSLCQIDSLSCRNGGVCDSHTGVCTCAFPFTGTYCDRCQAGRMGDDCRIVDHCYGNVDISIATCMQQEHGYVIDNTHSGYMYTCMRQGVCVEHNLDWSTRNNFDVKIKTADNKRDLNANHALLNSNRSIDMVLIDNNKAKMEISTDALPSFRITGFCMEAAGLKKLIVDMYDDANAKIDEYSFNSNNVEELCHADPVDYSGVSKIKMTLNKESTASQITLSGLTIKGCEE